MHTPLALCIRKSPDACIPYEAYFVFFKTGVQLKSAIVQYFGSVVVTARQHRTCIYYTNTLITFFFKVRDSQSYFEWDRTTEQNLHYEAAGSVETYS